MRLEHGWKHFGRPRGRVQGFTLLETIIAMSVLFIAMAGIVSVLLSTVKLRKFNEGEAKARNAAEQVFSAIRGMSDVVDAYGRFGGGGPEETFDVRGLQEPAPGVPVGRIIVWRLKDSLKDRATPPQPDPASALVLSQDDLLRAQMSFSSTFPAIMDAAAGAAGTAWNDYLDTNGDGLVTSADDPQLMPVSVRLRWRSQSGVTTQYYSAIIGKR
jgi:hypothetical protein